MHSLHVHRTFIPEKGSTVAASAILSSMHCAHYEQPYTVWMILHPLYYSGLKPHHHSTLPQLLRLLMQTTKVDRSCCTVCSTRDY